jgi:MFS family permease
MIRSVRAEWLRSRVGVLGERNFRRFYAGFVTSLLGSSMSIVAIAWAVLDSRVSATGLGLVFAATVVPQVLLLPLAGAIADRLGRRRVMIAADALRCAAQATLAVALAIGRPSLWLFVLLAWLGGMGTAFFTPALNALTVEIAPREQLGNANSLYGLAGSATRIAGPALGGVLVAVAGSAVVVAVDAGTYAVSVLALSLLQLPGTGGGTAGTPGREPAARSTLRADLAEGWADFRTRTWLWTQTVQFAFLNLITWAPWMLLGPVEGHAYLGGAAVWGAIMAVQGVGAIVAGLACLGRRPRRPMVVAVVATFGYALPDIPMALHAAAPWVALGAFACGAGSAISNAFSGTTMQQQIPPDRLARVSSLTLFPAYGIGVIGYAVDGPLAAVLGPALVFGVGAVYGLLSSAVVLALPSVRAVRWLDKGPVTKAPEPQLEPEQARPRAARLPLHAGRGAQGGERGQPRDHRDDHRDRQHLREVGFGRERDDAERHRHPAHGQGERRRDPRRAQGPAHHPAGLGWQAQHHPGEARGGDDAQRAQADRERQPVHVADRRDPDQDQRDEREHVDRPGHRAQDYHVDVPGVDALIRRGPRRGQEVPDRADRVVPPQADPAQLVHRAAVRGIQREGTLLMLARGGQVAAAQAHLAGQEVHVGLVGGQGPGPGRRVGGGVQPLGGQRGLSQAHMGLPVAGREPARLVRRAQRVPVVTQVDQRVAGQAVRPLVRRVERHRPVGHLDGLGVPVRAQVRAGHQAPGPGALRLGGNDARQQGRRLVEPPDVEHRRSARQFVA